MEQEDKKLNHFLNQCTVPKSNRDLTQKIVDIAMQEQQALPIWVCVKEIFLELPLPSPQYSFSILLLLSFFAGFASYSSPEIIETLLYHNTFL